MFVPKVFQKTAYRNKFIKFIDAGTAARISKPLADSFEYDGIITFGRPVDVDDTWFANYLQTGELPKAIECQVGFVTSCNYGCAHCIQNRFMSRANGWYDQDLKYLLTRAKLANRVFKAYQNKYHRPIIVTIIGGEVSMMPLELLKQAIDIMVEGIQVQEFNVTTNLQQSYEYFNELLFHAKSKGFVTNLAASFHDSVLDKKHGYQIYHSKLLKLSMDYHIGSVVTYSSTNQKDIVSHVEAALMLNNCYHYGHIPLRMVEDNSYDVKEGLFPEYYAMLHNLNENGELEFVGEESMYKHGTNLNHLMDSGKYICWPVGYNFYIGYQNDSYTVKCSLCEFDSKFITDNYGYVPMVEGKEDEVDVATLEKFFEFTYTPKVCGKKCKTSMCNSCKSDLLISKQIAKKLNFNYIELE